MEKETKNEIIKIVIAVLMLAVAVSVDKLFDLPIIGMLLIYCIPYLICGGEVLKDAFENIIHGELFDEDFLMSIATIGAMSIGFLPNAEPKFIEAVFVMILFKIGELFEDIAEGKSQKSIEDLMNIRPDYACIEDEGKLIKINPEDVKIDDIIIVSPGEKIPLDGIIVEGKTSLNMSALTGESMPKDVIENDEVFSGSISVSGKIKIKVTKKFDESTVSKIINLVKNAADKKSKSESFISKFSKIYTPIVVVSAILIAAVPTILFRSDFATWLLRALTFLVVSCPCALVISVPLSFFGGIGGASKKGILIKGSNYIDTLSRIKTIVFDKTGTLTEGVFEVIAVHPEVYDAEKLLHFAAHVERYSHHPIANSLKKAYEHEDDDCNVSDIEEFAGYGIRAKVNDDILYVGNEKLMEQLGIKWKECDHKGTIVHVAINGQYFGHIVISDRIKDDTKYTIDRIKKIGIKPIMLTGDKNEVGKLVAENIGIKEYYTELFPEDKSNKIEEIKLRNDENGKIAFIGDGINDSPALAIADVGIAMGALGADSAIEAADVVFMDDRISNILTAIKLSKRTIKIAHQNIIFAITIKITTLILAAFGVAPMWLAVFADVGVTIIAILNAMRTLKKIDN